MSGRSPCCPDPAPSPPPDSGRAAPTAPTPGGAGRTWRLPDTCLKEFHAAMQAVQSTLTAGLELIPGPKLEGLARHAWVELGADEEAAGRMASAMAAANTEAPDEEEEDEEGEEGDEEGAGDGQGSVNAIPWQSFCDQMLQAYTDVSRHKTLQEGLLTAQQALSVGPCITTAQRTAALTSLRACVAADTGRDSPEALQARLLLARQLHAFSCSAEDLSEAQRLLMEVMSIADNMMEGSEDEEEGDSSSSSDGEDDSDLKQVAATCMDSGRTLLSLMLAQAGRDKAAAAVMQQAGGLRYRLAPAILAYAQPGTTPATASMQQGADPSGYVCAFEDVLAPPMLSRLQSAFAPSSAFWSEHGYQTDGSTPYFSHVHQLGAGNTNSSSSSDRPTNLLDQLIGLLQQTAAQVFPEVKEARWAEWWAHCRPHGAGHQMHFDSDNEGCGSKVHNPIASMVLYLTEGVGGPTLVTRQAFGSSELPTSGWLVHPKLNRLTVFKGNVLHGVLPGRGVHSSDHPDKTRPPFRVTLMVALWDDIRVRTYPPGKHGAAQPFPYPQPPPQVPPKPTDSRKRQKSSEQRRTWPQLFTEPLLLGDDGGPQQGHQAPTGLVRAVPSYVEPIWADIDVDQNTQEGCHVAHLVAAGRLPSYNACFQGF